MRRTKKPVVDLGDADAAQPQHGSVPALPTPRPHTTALVAAALRCNQAEGGADYARAELIKALAGCCLYSMELDGLEATLALLADAAKIMELGYGDTGSARAAIFH